MSVVGLISCVSQKKENASEVRDIYVSNLFTKSRRFIEAQCDSWYVLSAKHGLLDPSDVIEPYNETLKSKSIKERKLWAQAVWKKLAPKLSPGDRIIILAGVRYRELLIPKIKEIGVSIDVPMEGLSIGRQLQWLNKSISIADRFKDLDRLYKLLEKLESGLGGKRMLAKCDGKISWPHSGIYLFFEDGEFRSTKDILRIVRVGTHGVSRKSKATLWNRLRSHRGSTDGRGNHRSSIFRLHVGASLAAKNIKFSVPSWGKGQSADKKTRKKEEFIERAVSEHIGKMQLLWLSVQDEPGPASDRAYIERNLIGLLSGPDGPIDLPSSKWLGRYCPKERIRESGLWNLDFVFYNYSPKFLNIFEEYVYLTINGSLTPTKSIAPKNWYERERQGIPNNQLLLFKES